MFEIDDDNTGIMSDDHQEEKAQATGGDRRLNSKCQLRSEENASGSDEKMQKASSNDIEAVFKVPDTPPPHSSGQRQTHKGKSEQTSGESQQGKPAPASALNQQAASAAAAAVAAAAGAKSGDFRSLSYNTTPTRSEAEIAAVQELLQAYQDEMEAGRLRVAEIRQRLMETAETLSQRIEDRFNRECERRHQQVCQVVQDMENCHEEVQALEGELREFVSGLQFFFQNPTTNHN